MITINILIIIVAMALPSINQLISPILFTRISSIVFIYAGALSFNAFYIQSIGSGIGIYSGLFHVTVVSQLLDAFIFIMGSFILISWPSITYSNNSGAPILGLLTMQKELTTVGPHKNLNTNSIYYAIQYSLIVLFSSLGASLLVSSADLISMYLTIELQSFGVYILSTIYRDSESATSAGLKYFLLGCLASCLILLGAVIIYAFTGLTNFESIYSLVSVSNSHNITQGLSLGLIIIFVGFLIKIAAAPLHNWSPDVYDESPTIVTIWLTIMPKISIIIFILELYTQIGIIGYSNSLPEVKELLDTVSIINLNQLYQNIVLSENTFNILKNLLLISSLISLIIGTIVGLAQSKIKRLLAYSTISHIGFILLALAINTEQSIDSLIFYIIQYSLTNLNIFLIIIALGYIINNSLPVTPIYKGTERDIKFISEFKGQFYINPLLSICFTICLFSMAGIPPLLGFFSKQFVLYSAIQSGYYFMAIIGIIVSVISASYYLKIIRVLHSEPEQFNNIAIANGAGAGDENKDDSKNTLVGTESNMKEEITNTNSDTSVFPSLGGCGGDVETINSIFSPTNFHSFMISILTLSILLFILKPSLLLNSTQLLSLSLFNC